jgi:hypothetical protein
MPSQPELYFSFLIREECDGGKTLTQLTRRINDANQKAHTHCQVNRRLLQKLRDGVPQVGVTLETSVALDTYFRSIGKVTMEIPWLVYPAAIDTLVRTPRVHFLYGAKPRPKERRIDVSCWDLDAGAHLLTAASRASARCEFAIAHVLWHNDAGLRTVQAEPWHHLLEQDQEGVVSIGSPLASLSTEVMLARMFGAVPFQTPGVEAARQLPFWYCWAPVIAGRFRSAFALTSAELQAFDPGIAARVRANQSHAFCLEGKIHEVPRTGKTWKMHGILAAQRRPAGNLWLVVAGLAGPATCAAAKLAPDLQAVLPWQEGQASSVLWAPVLAHIREGVAERSRGDIRELEEVQFVGRPRQSPATSRPAATP